MELLAHEVDIGTRTPTVLLNSEDATELGAHPLDRVQVTWNGRTTTGIVEITDELVAPGSLGVTHPLRHIRGPVDIALAPKPDSVTYLTKKLNDIELEKRELGAIVRDIYHDRLNDVELSAFVCSVYANGLSREEIQCLTACMVDVGETIDWEQDVIVDKHSIGGVAGNRVTPIVVPIVAAAGLTIPKTSSRAITSAAGTADTIEVFCDVSFSLSEIKAIVGETNGCMVWGGAVNLSPVDDKIIRAETPLSLDPPGQVIASVLSKKRSVGSTHVLIDVPYGEGSKVSSFREAREFAEDFTHVGDQLGMQIECALTRGEQPIGRGIGPVLEARDVLSVLDGGGPDDLRLKSERIAQILLDTAGVDADAASIIESGRARTKFDEIVAAQGGDPTITLDGLTPGRYQTTLVAEREGVVTRLDNRLVNELARRAGAPKDAAAGVYLHHQLGDAVEVDDELVTLYARKQAKLGEAEEYAVETEPVRVRSREEALVEHVSLRRRDGEG